MQGSGWSGGQGRGAAEQGPREDADGHGMGTRRSHPEPSGQEAAQQDGCREWAEANRGVARSMNRGRRKEVGEEGN